MERPNPDVLIVANVLARERVVGRLASEGATTPAKALPLDGLDSVTAAALEELVRAKAVRRTGRGYYLDQAAYRSLHARPFRHPRLLFALVFVLVVAVLAAGVWLALRV